MVLGMSWKSEHTVLRKVLR